MKSASLRQKIYSVRKFPVIIVLETEKIVEPRFPGLPRGNQEYATRNHPDFCQYFGNQNGCGIGVSVQLVPIERKRVYCPRCWIVNWTHIQWKSVVVSGRK
ncbi:hypothetical protein DPMN_083834 [Dreissena polymorpha]|uniref:Uncharacterized protein n=1 Tax=Dreissena polymorpha TaxID=45954 RepID=A0A9D4BI26_DREPO|nr:hypothetical protein DPMN_083834 [Dreissena polymorpha]